MSNRVQKYCNDCRTNRRCTTEAEEKYYKEFRYTKR